MAPRCRVRRRSTASRHRYQQFDAISPTLSEPTISHAGSGPVRSPTYQSINHRLNGSISLTISTFARDSDALTSNWKTGRFPSCGARCREPTRPPEGRRSSRALGADKCFLAEPRSRARCENSPPLDDVVLQLNHLDLHDGDQIAFGRRGSGTSWNSFGIWQDIGIIMTIRRKRCSQATALISEAWM